MKKRLIMMLKYVSIFVIVLIFYGTTWFISTFDELALDEIIFHLKVPMTGSNNDFLVSFMKGPFLSSLYLFILITIILVVVQNIFKMRNRLIMIPIIIMLIFSNVYAFTAVGAGDYLKNNLVDSPLYSDYYVHPDKEILIFPEKKRNLIYIFLESYESTFTSKKYGGALQENTLGKMVDLAYEHDHFSNNRKIGGAAAATGTTWTVGGMLAQTSGVHLSLPIEGNSYGQYDHFLPGVVSIGDLLEQEGYNQTLLIGSDAEFGGRSNYFIQHGNYEIKDYVHALENELIPDGYKQWWGYEDEKLFEFAKDKLLNLASQDKPFNLTMLTADTHHVDGYVTENMDFPYEEQYSNVFFHSSKQVYEFISWVQKQNFYKDTTIVVVGDHHSMDAGFIERNVDEDYDRRIFNVIINSVVEPYKKTNRKFATFDLFPTTLASMGIEIDGDRLGLGTNLYSDKETLFEEQGIEFINKELAKRSSFYSRKLLTKSD